MQSVSWYEGQNSQYVLKCFLPFTEDVGVFAGMEDETTQYIELLTERKATRRFPRVITREADLNTSEQDGEEPQEDTGNSRNHSGRYWKNTIFAISGKYRIYLN